jgi:hypothetical protein
MDLISAGCDGPTVSKKINKVVPSRCFASPFLRQTNPSENHLKGKPHLKGPAEPGVDTSPPSPVCGTCLIPLINLLICLQFQKQAQSASCATSLSSSLETPPAQDICVTDRCKPDVAHPSAASAFRRQPLASRADKTLVMMRLSRHSA